MTSREGKYLLLLKMILSLLLIAVSFFFSPLGFMAELPSSDTLLCADELAPVELDSGPYETTIITSAAEKLSVSSIKMSQPPSASPSSPPESLDEDDIYSAGTPTRPRPSLDSRPRPTGVGDVTLKKTEPPARSINTRSSESSNPESASKPISLPISRVPAEIEKPIGFSESRQANSNTPLLSITPTEHPAQRAPVPGRSIDDICAMPSSLQPHQPISTRMRSKSATHEPWRPSIKFVQTGVMQESQVSTPALSGSFNLEQRGEDSSSVEDTRVSAWLKGQAGPAKLQERDPKRDPKRKIPDPRPSGVDSVPAAPTGLLPPLPLARKTSEVNVTEQRDRVVETIIHMPSVESMTVTRGVQLVDVSPGLPRSSNTRRGAAMKKRFSWEIGADEASGEAVEDATNLGYRKQRTPTEPTHKAQPSVPQDVGNGAGPPLGHDTNRTKRSSQSMTPGRHQRNQSSHLSPRTAPSTSPRLPFETVSPTHGKITANRVVVIESTEDRKASTATFETGLKKPLPPLPLAPKGRVTPKIELDQPKSHAFEQMSELIAVANAAMPSARPRSAVPPGPSAESVWRSIRTQTSHTAQRPELTTASSNMLSATTPDLSGRPAGHARSISQLTGPQTGLQPPRRQHTRSQSMVSPSTMSPTQHDPFKDVDDVPQPLTNSVWPRLQVIPPPSDGHKSHKRLSIHTTPAGVFAFHPLRSSPVFSPTSDDPETQEPQPLDDVKEPTTSLSLPKSFVNGTSRTSKADRPRLQVKMPFVGLPTSPRPSPRPRPEPKAEESQKTPMQGSREKPVVDESNIDQPTSLDRQRRPSTQSQVSSPTSSIFSSMRDSSVSATSSMEDLDSTPTSDPGADMNKSQAQCIPNSHLQSSNKEKIREQMPTEIVKVHIDPSDLCTSPTVSASVEVPQATEHSCVPTQRPANVPAAIRPAGMRASLWERPRKEDRPTGQPIVPTLVVRAPTVKSRPSGRRETSNEPLPLPQSPRLPLASPKHHELNTNGYYEPLKSPAIHVVLLNEDSEQQTASPTKQQGFIQSLRKSWQFTTSNAPRLSLFAGRQGHTRSRSQSTLPERHGLVAEAIAAVGNKQATMPWQWTGARDNWTNRDSLPVDTGSISNVDATIRFFNSTLSGRSKPVDIDQPEQEMPRPDFGDDAKAKTIVVRKVGPPIVVRKCL